MEGPRPPTEPEFSRVMEFLNTELRAGTSWSIESEYPTALTQQNRHNMRIIEEAGQILSHAVVRPLILKTPHAILKVATIGSVVTSEKYRNQGHSQAVLKECLDMARLQSCDLAVLWTNLFDFYRKMNFELAGSEILLTVTKPFQRASNLNYKSDGRVSPEALMRLFGQHSVHSVRSLDDFKKSMSIPKTQIYTAWNADGSLAAYAVEGKGADLNGYIHEWGGQVSAITSLVSYIQEQRKIPITVIAPAHSQNLIRQMEAYGAQKVEGFLGMFHIVHFDSLAFKLKRAFRNAGEPNIMLEKQNGLYLFGIGTDFVTTPKEADLIQLLLGPVDYEALGVFKPDTIARLKKVLPLPLWIWGWDSI